MKILFISLVLLAFLPTSGQQQTLLLTNARVVDVIEGRIGEPTDILIENGVIRSIGPRFSERYTGDRQDLQGAYVLPGLINAHLHLGNDPNESAESRYRTLEYLLRHGITTIRDAAGDARILRDLQQKIRQGVIQGPDIYYAAFVAGPAYFKDNDREKNMVTGLDTAFAPWLQCIRPGDNLSEAMKAARCCGATGIKIYGGFDRPQLIPLIATARKEGLQIWGHATLFPAKPTDVAEAGMHVISHAYMLEWEAVKDTLSGDIFKNYELYYPGINHRNIDVSRFISAIKKQDAIFDPTLYLCMINKMEWSAEIVRQAYTAGVKICAGTDYIEDLARPFPFLFDELDLYVKACGFTPLDAIRTATQIGAEVVGKEKEIGTVTPGKNADLLILEKNPLEDIGNLRTIRMVIKNGKKIE